MPDREELLVALALALPEVGTKTEYAVAALDAIEPLIRDDERRHVGTEANRLLRAKDERIADLLEDRDRLRTNVEHMRRVIQREIDAAFKVPGSFVATDIGRREALDDVLDLMKRDDDD